MVLVCVSLMTSNVRSLHELISDLCIFLVECLIKTCLLLLYQVVCHLTELCLSQNSGYKYSYLIDFVNIFLHIYNFFVSLMASIDVLFNFVCVCSLPY